jgi:universal stress protein A
MAAQCSMTLQTIEEHGVQAKTERPISLKKILVPVDFSEASNSAVKYALRISGITHSKLMFLNVLEPETPVTVDNVPYGCLEELKENAEENLRALTRASHESGITKTTSLTRCGLPAHEIVEEAKESDVDLIVIATHGYTGWKHFCIGSTAEKVVRAAPCPVLVVREKENEF